VARIVAEIAEEAADLAALVVPRLDHPEEYLLPVLEHTAVLVAATDLVVERSAGGRS
jgi:hypothetical protein